MGIGKILVANLYRQLIFENIVGEVQFLGF